MAPQQAITTGRASLLVTPGMTVVPSTGNVAPLALGPAAVAAAEAVAAAVAAAETHPGGGRSFVAPPSVPYGAVVGGGAVGSCAVPPGQVLTGGSCSMPPGQACLAGGSSHALPQGVTMAIPAPTPMPVPVPVVPRPELADPETIHSQKEQYAKDLEEQLRRGVEVLGETHKQQTDELRARANREKTRYNLAMDQQVKQKELLLSQEYNEQLMRLQQAAQAKRADLEQQATTLTLEFQQRKLQEEFMVQQMGIQQQHQLAQARINEEMHRLGVIGASHAGASHAALVPGTSAAVDRVAPPSSATLSCASVMGTTAPPVAPVMAVAQPRPVATALAYAGASPALATAAPTYVTALPAYATAPPAYAATAPATAAATGGVSYTAHTKLTSMPIKASRTSLAGRPLAEMHPNRPMVGGALEPMATYHISR